MNLKSIIYQKDNRISVQKILFIFFLLISSIYFTCIIIAPGKSLRSMDESFRAMPIKTKIPDIESEHIDSLLKLKAYYEARTTMARIDSLGLSVSLRDSIVNLEIRGISIHSSPILLIKTDNFFTNLSKHSYYYIFSKPLIARSHFSYIKKEPVRIVDAPTDTNQAAKELEIDSINASKTLVMYSLDTIGKLILLPSDSKGFYAWANEKAFLTAIRTQNTVKNLESLIHFKIPNYTPVTIIYITHEDILTFYRALPERGKICIQH